MQKFDLYRYWYSVFSSHNFYLIRPLFRRALEKNLKVDVVIEHTNALEHQNQFPHGVIVGDLFYRVATFLEETGKYPITLFISLSYLL
jgi:hypothetical protein